MSKAPPSTPKINYADDVPCRAPGCPNRGDEGEDLEGAPQLRFCTAHRPANFHALRDRDNAERAASQGKAA